MEATKTEHDDIEYKLSTGVKFNPNLGILGIAAEPDRDGVRSCWPIYGGYDGVEVYQYQNYKYNKQLTPAECREVADYMKDVWERWALWNEKGLK
ncbi:hypothetical protein KDA11_05720 [Candidatus Saccharibacteria bacterium]|nr:hypothetical protein [Candidatus Saccharibacteria bacterium]